MNGPEKLHYLFLAGLSRLVQGLQVRLESTKAKPNGLTLKYQIQLEKPVRNKHSSLLVTSIIYEEAKVLWLRPLALTINIRLGWDSALQKYFITCI
jgi:hypothetical protein